MSWATVTCGWYGKRVSRASGPDRTRRSSCSQLGDPAATDDEDHVGDRPERAGAGQVHLERRAPVGGRRQVLVDACQPGGGDLRRRQQRDVRRDPAARGSPTRSRQR